MTEHIFLSNVAYTDGAEDPLESLETTLAYAVDDWGSTRAMSWVWGIVCGWEDAMEEQARKHGWDAETVARLERLHAEFERLKSDKPLDG